MPGHKSRSGECGSCPAAAEVALILSHVGHDLKATVTTARPPFGGPITRGAIKRQLELHVLDMCGREPPVAECVLQNCRPIAVRFVAEWTQDFDTFAHSC